MDRSIGIEKSRAALTAEQAIPSLAVTAHSRRSLGLTISGYLAAIAGVGLAAVVAGRLEEQLNTLNISLLFLFVVLIAATSLGYGPAIVASVLGVLSFYLEYYPPYGLNSDLQVEDWLTLGFFLAFAIATSRLASSARTRAEEAMSRERESRVLQRLGESLRVSGDQSTMLAAVATRLREIFGAAACTIWLCDRHGAESVGGSSGEPDLSGGCAASVPLDAGAGPIGRLEMNLGAARPPLSAVEQRMLKTFARQAAQAIEVTRLGAEARAASVLREADQLKTALLRTISHDLRTPLATIKARASSLLEGDIELDAGEWQESMHAIDIEADRLSRLVEEVLDMSRIEAGALQPCLELYAAEDAVSATLPNLENATDHHRLLVDVDGDLPMVEMDITLIVRVLANLLENAVKYAPPGSTVRLAAREHDEGLLFEVIDEGPGIPGALRERVFDAFYRMDRPQEVKTYGAGLGLSICRGIIAAHGGWIRIDAAPGSGTAVRFWLPGPALSRTRGEPNSPSEARPEHALIGSDG